MCTGIFLRKTEHKSRGNNEDAFIPVQPTNSIKTIATEDIKIGPLSTSLSSITEA